MARPRQIAANRSATGSYKLPEYTEDDWKKFEQILGCTFLKSQKDTITSSVHDYIDGTKAEKNGAEVLAVAKVREKNGLTKQKRSSIQRFCRLIKQTTQVWNAIYADDTQFRLMNDFCNKAKINQTKRPSLKRNMYELQIILPQLANFLNSQKAISTKTKKNPRTQLIEILALIVQLSTGKKVPKTKPTDTSRKIPPFASFVYELNKSFTKDTRLCVNTTKAAFAQMIYRELRSRK